MRWLRDTIVDIVDNDRSEIITAPTNSIRMRRATLGERAEMNNEEKIRNCLIKHGRHLFEAKKCFREFTGNHKADSLLNDLKRYSHAYVIACVMDRQMPAEKAWYIPYRLAMKLGDFRFSTLVSLSLDRVCDLMRRPEALHRFPDEMAKNLYEAVQIIAKSYSGSAKKIWEGQPSSAEVVYRFLQFRGVGQKIATMAANILAREFKVQFSDYYSVDVSADVHIRRVFRRLGLVSQGASTEEFIYKARVLNPEFPGLLDSPSWEIGRNWCKPKHPRCGECYMNELCLTCSSLKGGS